MKYKFVFGVFNTGGLVFAKATIECTHAQAALLVAVLNLGAAVLNPGDYFAYDYA
jgi:hypothetical protein